MEQKSQGVQNVLPRLKKAYHRGRMQFMKLRYGSPAQDARVIIVTGAAGKTTTAQLLMGLLLEAGHSVAVYDPGVHGHSAANLLRGLEVAKKQNAAYVVIEVSPDLLKSGALDSLTFNTVVVTNACPESRLLLARAADYVVIPDDHESGALAVAEHQIATFGNTTEADIKIDAVKLFRKGTEITFTLDHHTELQIATHLIGQANTRNVAAAIATAYILGVPMDTVEEGVARLEKLPGNFEYTPTEHPFTVITDKARSEASVEQVIMSAKELAKRRLVVALAITEPHTGFLTRMQQYADRLIVVGDSSRVPSNIEVAESPEAARAIAERAAKKDDTVLLIGEGFIISTHEL